MSRINSCQKVLCTLMVLIVFNSFSKTIAQEITATKNVILLIGDGMGVTQVYAAMSTSQEKLNIERSHYFGYSKTYSLTNYTTDSGAGATAISTGKKTKNKAIAVDSNDRVLKTIIEYATEKGLKTGVVSACNLVHATPAAFITHQALRYNYNDIALDYLNTEADVLIGGGSLLFDSLGVTSGLINKGYEVTYSLDSIDLSSHARIVCFVAEDHPSSVLNGRGDMLPKATGLALNKLSSENQGFFLMVEGSQIDWGGHDNDIDYVVSELIDFDKAVGIAYDFADKNPGTLVVVTADHETGGLTLPKGDIRAKTIESSFSTKMHSGVMVPIFAYGEGAENFSQIMQNTDIFQKIMNALNLDSDTTVVD